MKLSENNIIGVELQLNYHYDEFAPNSIYLQIVEGPLMLEMYSNQSIQRYFSILEKEHQHLGDREGGWDPSLDPFII